MKLKANYGSYLTQSADVPIEQRKFLEIVYLSSTAEATRWREVTEAEKAKLISQSTAVDVDNLTAESLTKLEEQIEAIPTVINQASLTAEEALAHKDWFPVWGEEGAEFGKQVQTGFRLRYRENEEDEYTLYEVIQPHNLQENWKPGMDTASLYKVVEATAGDTHEGTPEDPIPYVQGMAFEQGKYYSQDGVVYECILTTETGYPNDLKDLPTIVKPV